MCQNEKNDYKVPTWHFSVKRSFIMSQKSCVFSRKKNTVRIRWTPWWVFLWMVSFLRNLQHQTDQWICFPFSGLHAIAPLRSLWFPKHGSRWHCQGLIGVRSTGIQRGVRRRGPRALSYLSRDCGTVRALRSRTMPSSVKCPTFATSPRTERGKDDTPNAPTHTNITSM